MPHRPNPIPRLNNPQYAATSLTSSPSASSTVQNAPHTGTTNSSRRDLNTVPPRHRGHSFSATTQPSILNQDGNVPNRGDRTGGGSQRTLPPPRFQRKQRPPRVQNILAGPDNIDRSLGTLTFGPATNWGVGTQTVVSLPMAAVNAASSAVALSPSLFNNPTFNAPTDDHSSAPATAVTGFTRPSAGSIPHPTNHSPPQPSFRKSAIVPHSTSLPNPPAHLLCVPSREDPAVGPCAPSVLAPYFASPQVNHGCTIDHLSDEPHFSAPSIGSIQPPPKSDPDPPTTLKSALKHQRSIPNLSHPVHSPSLARRVPEKPLPSTPAPHSVHNIKFLDGQDVISHPPHVGGLAYEQGLLGSDEEGLQAPDMMSVHPPQGAGLDEWEEFVEALAAGVVEDEEYLLVSDPLASGPVVRVSPPSRSSNPPPTAIPAGFVESTALTRTTRGRPVSALGAHPHRVPPYVPRRRSRSRSPSPTLSGNGSCESAGSMGSLPGLGSFGSGSTGGSKPYPPSSRSSNISSNNASMASLTSRSTISSGKSLRTIDSYGSLRSSASGAFTGPLLGGSSIWAMDKEEAGPSASIGTIGVASGSTLSLVPEEGTGFGGNGYGLPKGVAPVLEPFGAFEPTPRRKDRIVGGFSNATFANLPKKAARSTFHARAPSEVSDNPFASIEAISGSPPSSPPHKPSALTPTAQHVPLIPIAEAFVPRKGGASAIPPKQNTVVGSSLSGNAKAFIPRSSGTQGTQFYENTDHGPGRMAIRNVEDVFVGATRIIGGFV